MTKEIEERVNFALERVEAYIEGLLETLEKYQFKGDEKAIGYIKGISNHIKSVKIEEGE